MASTPEPVAEHSAQVPDAFNAAVPGHLPVQDREQKAGGKERERHQPDQWRRGDRGFGPRQQHQINMRQPDRGPGRGPDRQEQPGIAPRQVHGPENTIAAGARNVPKVMVVADADRHSRRRCDRSMLRATSTIDGASHALAQRINGNTGIFRVHRIHEIVEIGAHRVRPRPHAVRDPPSSARGLRDVTLCRSY